VTAREARALGVQQIYAPVADINNNAANPVINVRSYVKSPPQSPGWSPPLSKARNTVGTRHRKHFPGHGDTATDSIAACPRLMLRASV